MKSKVCKGITGTGIAALFVQLCSFIGTLRGGGSLPRLSFDSTLMFSFSLGMCIGYYAFGIVGIILLILGLVVLPRAFGFHWNSKGISKKLRKKAESEKIRFCPECGGSVKATELFCPKCHHKM